MTKCKKHLKYKAIHRPTADCKDCQRMLNGVSLTGRASSGPLPKGYSHGGNQVARK